MQYQDKTITQAGNEVIFDVLKPVGGTGGVIIIDTKGKIFLQRHPPLIAILKECSKLF